MRRKLQAVPQARPFVTEDFLSGLDETAPALTCGVKGDWPALYRKFLSCPNFEGWLSSRRKDVQRQLETAHLEVVCSADLSPAVLRSRHQVEVVDLVLKLCDRITAQPPSSQLRPRLQAQLTAIMQSVDDDLNAYSMDLGRPGSSVPSCIAGYTVCERLGTGAFSTVYKALATSASPSGVRRTVAIKCMDMRAANASRLSSDCVVSEIRILKSLKHRNVVGLLEFCWDKKNIYLIMEYCGGGDLATFIKQYGALSEPVARRFFRQLAAALFYLRAMDVAHMDLKPHNIMLTNRYAPVIKVSDFGLSQYLTHNQSASSFRGSPLYMAPEIFLGQQYDSRVDLWSAGVILYECLYGQPPFCTPNYDTLVQLIVSSAPLQLPTTPALSQQCVHLLTGLLQKNPQHRLNFDQFFAHPFVDLACAPSVDQLNKAHQLVSDALIAESKHDTVQAVRLLTNAIHMYMACLELFQQQQEKDRFRDKIRDHLAHAEELKDSLRPMPTQAVVSSSLCSQWPDCPQVEAALKVAAEARRMQMEECWEQSLDKYTLAIEAAMQVISNDRLSARASALQRSVSTWLSSAENIKAYLTVLNQDQSTQSEDPVFQQLRTAKQCAIM